MLIKKWSIIIFYSSIYINLITLLSIHSYTLYNISNMENSRRSRHSTNSQNSRHSSRSSSSDSSYHRHSKHKHSHKHSNRHSRHDRDRDRTRSCHSRRSYSSDRYSDRHRSRSHRREKYSTASSTSHESQRYRFDSPPKTSLDYNQKIWYVYKTSVNPEEFIDRVQQVVSIVPSAQVNKLDRELYIGNLPSGVTISQLMELHNNAMINLGLNKYPGPPVMSAWISNDGYYAFVEFRSIEEAQAGYAFNDSCILGQPLKVGKPKNCAGNQPATVSGLQALNMTAVGLNRISEEMASKILGGKGRLMISGLPHGLVVDECKKILEEFGKLKCLDMPKDPITGLTKGYAVFDYEEDVSMAEALQQRRFLYQDVSLLYLAWVKKV